MEETLAAWLTSCGVPRSLVPDSLALVGLGGFAGGLLILWRARRDGAPIEREARALAITFVAAWLGAALFELVWSLPTLIAERSLASTPEVDRNFYGGLLAGSAAGAAYMRWRRAPVLPYLDRTVLLWGSVIVSTRLGCLLEGCCFGTPTTSAIGVRFPADSPAAAAHAGAGWIPDGAASLPVHMTQLYEVALGIIATALACWLGRRTRRAGAAFATWIGTYACGRLALESLRATSLPSPIEFLTRGQLVSALLLLALAAVLARGATATR